MTEGQSELKQLLEACWEDESLKQRLISDPKSVLTEYGLGVPDGMDVKVHENTADCVHFTLPARPGASVTLTDEELASAAGAGCGCGGTTNHCGYTHSVLTIQ